MVRPEVLDLGRVASLRKQLAAAAVSRVPRLLYREVLLPANHRAGADLVRRVLRVVSHFVALAHRTLVDRGLAQFLNQIFDFGPATEMTFKIASSTLAHRLQLGGISPHGHSTPGHQLALERAAPLRQVVIHLVAICHGVLLLG